MMEHEIKFDICDGDFEQTFGRKPKSKKEFEEFCYYVDKGLRNGHIDWTIVFDCAKDSMQQ